VPWFAIIDLNPYPPRARLLFPVWSGLQPYRLLHQNPALSRISPVKASSIRRNPHHAGLLPYSVQLSHHPFHSPTSPSILCSRKQPVVVASPLPFSDHLARSLFPSEIFQSSIVLVFFLAIFDAAALLCRSPVFRRHPVRPCYRAPLHRCHKKYAGQNKKEKKVGDQGRTRPPCRQYSNLRTSSAMASKPA
jgi:hypothetical protein